MEQDDWKVRLRRRKLNVRFDEGELEIGQHHYASSLLYPISVQKDVKETLDKGR